MTTDKIDREIRAKERQIESIKGGKSYRQWDIYEKNQEKIREIEEDIAELREKRKEALGVSISRALIS